MDKSKKLVNDYFLWFNGLKNGINALVVLETAL